MSNYKKLTVMQ